MKATRLIAVVIPALLLSACLTTREEIRVHPDGSLTVAIRGEGDIPDLIEGYSLPADSRWQAVGNDTKKWLLEIGRDFGSPAARDRVDAGEWASDKRDKGRAVTLAFTRRYGSASEMEERFVPGDAAYATAYLARSADLKIVERNGKKLYTFRRIIKRRDATVDRIWDFATDYARNLEEKLKEGKPLTDEERDQATEVLSKAFLASAAWYGRTAIAAIYTEGNGSLSLADHKTVMENGEAALRAVTREEDLAPVIRMLEEESRAKAQGEKPVEQAGPWLRRKEQQIRDLVRKTVRTELAGVGVDVGTINGAMYRLEWLITSTDHTHDLKDDTFEFEIRMPGTIVSGNFLELESDGAAKWRFAGKDLLLGDIIVEVTSVVE